VAAKHIRVQQRHHKTISQQKLLEMVSKSLKMEKDREESMSRLSEYTESIADVYKTVDSQRALYLKERAAQTVVRNSAQRSNRAYGQSSDVRNNATQLKQRPTADVYNSLVVEPTTKRSSSSKKSHSNVNSNHYRSITDANQLTRNTNSLFKMQDAPSIIKDNFMTNYSFVQKTSSTKDVKDPRDAKDMSQKGDISKITVQKKSQTTETGKNSLVNVNKKMQSLLKSKNN